jgi:hypothetical protein
MVGEVLTLPQLDKGVFIGGWKSGRWRQPELRFGGKFGTAGLWAEGPADGPAGPDISSGARRLAGRIRRPAERRFRTAVQRLRRAGPVCHRMVRRWTSLCAELAHFWQAIPPSFYLHKKTPSPVNLNLNAYISNISSHKT